MRKVYVTIILFLVIFSLSGCNRVERLLILNWGEYINDEVVENFEAEYNVNVSISLAESNEAFYSKIKSGTTAYDLVIPSDYMIEKMYEKNLLQPINLNKLSNYDPINNPFMPGVKGIQDLMFDDNEKYAIPYFWGTFGLMYNKQKNGLEEAILENGWNAYFEVDKRPKDTRIAMYNVPRFTYAASLLYQDLDPNLETKVALDLVYETLTRFRFDEWGTDLLKKNISSDNLDLAFVYTGDFLDMLYIKLSEGISLDEISFDIFIPDNTIAFLDAMVIPKKARHVDLAHLFIDYMLRPENAYENAKVVGYCTPLLNSYNQIINYDGDDFETLARASANRKYYPMLDNFKGIPLANLDREFLNKIDTIINNAKAKW